ncbi:MAG: DUF92 domain-containing protein [Candidatus Methanomethylophilaceae archaeon]|nr:DUF92 domain-containing protein [Candidatus Methanomethylophilaceae archaeon]
MEQTTLAVLAVILSAVLSLEAYKLHCLTRLGSVASFAVGSLVGVFGSINAFFLMTVFTVCGFLVTIKDFDRKKAAGLQEGELGERDWTNVLGVALPPCMAAVANYLWPMQPEVFYVLFISTITVAGADTIASEIGVRDSRTYMITTMKPCEPGVNGGVSPTGTAVSTVAALLIAILGWFAMTGTVSAYALVPFAMGVLGNVLDSVFGALLENRGYISKYTNNCSTAIIASVMGAVIMHCILF